MSAPSPTPGTAPAPSNRPAPHLAEGWDGHVHVFDGNPVPATHYQASQHTLAMLQAVAARLGLGRFVLVQPSVFRSDNRLLLQTLAAQPGRHRGVVVLQGDEPDAELDRMAAAGVRGVRLNRVSPIGQAQPAVAGLAHLAPRLRERGWFVQWYCTPEHWAQVAALSARYRLLPVLDHLAGITTALWADGNRPDRHPGPGSDLGAVPGNWRDGLARLADQGAWLKLSGWYRLAATPPYTALLPVIAALHRQFDGRCLWGSDWPHTHFMEPGIAAAPPGYASLLAPLITALGQPAALAVLHSTPLRLLA